MQEATIPEGPEVEVVARQLHTLIASTNIVASRSHHNRFAPIPATGVKKVDRHGKWILFNLSNGSTAAIHLGMSGRFVVGKECPPNIRWEILFSQNGGRRRALRYVDNRIFGQLRIIDRKSDPATTLGLGVDILSWAMVNESDYNREMVWRTALDTNKPVKQALLDQSRLAGIGNMYASEICWLARIHPNRPARNVATPELHILLRETPALLLESIRCGGTSFGDANSFRDLFGTEGRNGKNLQVYARDGLECRRCKSVIVRSMDHGRSTFLCPTCQPE